MKKETNVYAIASFHSVKKSFVAGESDKIITIVDEHANVIRLEDGYIYLKTSKNINPRLINSVSVIFNAGKSKLFFEGKIDALKKNSDQSITYRLIIPKEVEKITLPSGKVVEMINEQVKKYKSSLIAGRRKKQTAEIIPMERAANIKQNEYSV